MDILGLHVGCLWVLINAFSFAFGHLHSLTGCVDR